MQIKEKEAADAAAAAADDSEIDADYAVDSFSSSHTNAVVTVATMLVPRPPALYRPDPYFDGCVQTMELRQRLGRYVVKRTTPPSAAHPTIVTAVTATATDNTVDEAIAAAAEAAVATIPMEVTIEKIDFDLEQSTTQNYLPAANTPVTVELLPPPPPYHVAIRQKRRATASPAARRVKRARTNSERSTPNIIFSSLRQRREARTRQLLVQRRQIANPQAAVNECDQCGRVLHVMIGHARTHSELFLSQRLVRVCRECRRCLHRLHFGSVAAASVPTGAIAAGLPASTAIHVQYLEPLATLVEPMGADSGMPASSPATISVNMVSRLQRLGTSIMLEEAAPEVVVAAEPTAPPTVPSPFPCEMLATLQQSSPLLFSTLMLPRSASNAAYRNSRLMRTYRRVQQYRNQHQQNAIEVDNEEDNSSSSSCSGDATTPAMMGSASQRFHEINEIRSGRSAASNVRRPPHTNHHHHQRHDGYERNEKNEIVLAFDRTLTEVFPVADRQWMSSGPAHTCATTSVASSDSGCSSGDDDSSSSSSLMLVTSARVTGDSVDSDNDSSGVRDDVDDESHDGTDSAPHRQSAGEDGAVADDSVDAAVIDDIYTRIPKSLSITLLA